MKLEFTGRHMLMVMIAFFGTVIAVNIVMATYATRTFGGTVVENSYVASQEFNGWLEAARRQAADGWTAKLGEDDDRATVDASSGGEPLAGASVSGVARHPLGRAPDIALKFREVAPGRFVADMPLPAGRWLLHVTIARDGNVHRLVGELS